MRLYEFSKKCDIQSKELLAKLRKAGFKVASHMSVLNDDALTFLKREITKKMPTQSQSSRETAPSKDFPSSNKESFSKISSTQVEASPKEIEADKKNTIVLEPMLVGCLADKLAVDSGELILSLLKSGIMAPKNKLLSIDIIETIARHYGAQIQKPARKLSPTIERNAFSEKSAEFQEERAPVVVVVGHVDHGKTTLLDYIRQSRVALKEKGGITQHLGAYSVATNHGKVVFLDTPGHEAFTKMRARGVNIADLVVLVIAADDGIMPQTVESIKVAKELKVPIVVAVNKMDKVDSQRIEVIKRQLSQYDLLPEDWGGSVVVAPISAKEGTGVDHLLEMLVLQAEMMELTASKRGIAFGHIIESRMQKGLGAVGTLLCQQGTVHVGDYFLCGETIGKVISLMDFQGKSIKSAGPTEPVQVSGFVSLPEAGATFSVISQKEFKKLRSSGVKNAEERLSKESFTQKENTLCFLVKADTHSSKEAIVDSIAKLQKKLKNEISISVASASVGNISEANVDLAATIQATILGFNVKSDANAHMQAKRLHVNVEHYGIIYKLLEAVEAKMEASREVKMISKKIGEAIVRKVFDIKNVGVIAGCYVQDGRFAREGSVAVWRGRKKIGEGKIESLQRANKTVKEVHVGYECAFSIKDYTDYAIDDRIECYIEVPEK